MPSVELSNVTVRFRDREDLKSISAVFEPGVHVVLGRNGAGKTTLLKAVADLVSGPVTVAVPKEENVLLQIYYVDKVLPLTATYVLAPRVVT